MITSCEPYISKGIVKSFLECLLLIVISGYLRSLIIFVILRLIVGIAAPCFGRETQSFAMPGGAILQSMLTPVPLDTFLFFFLSTTVKSASSFYTAGADCGLSALLPNTLANVGDEGCGGSIEVGG